MAPDRGSRYLRNECRGPVWYVPVSRQGTHIGYVWASADDDAVGFVCGKRNAEVFQIDPERLTEHWLGRLREASLGGHRPIAMLTSFEDEIPDPVFGVVTTGVRPVRARTFARLLDRAEPTRQHTQPSHTGMTADDYFNGGWRAT